MIKSCPESNVVILDRDGTIVVDRGYLAEPDGLEFLPEAPEALRLLCDTGHRLVVISNQSGVGRGFFSLECVEAMNVRLMKMVREAGAQITSIYVCPHAPGDNCRCRKPNLALMQQAASDLHFDPRKSVVVGDKESDMEFGLRAGAKTIWIIAGAVEPPTMLKATQVVTSLIEAARFITSSE